MRRSVSSRHGALVLSVLAAAACRGNIAANEDEDLPRGTDGKAGAGGAQEGGGRGPSPIDDEPRAPGGSPRPEPLSEFFDAPADKMRPLARLGRAELEAIAQDLFGVTIGPEDLGPLPNARAVDVTIDPNQYVEGVWAWAAAVATRAFASDGSLASFCSKRGVVELACAKALAVDLGKLLLQRKLTATEANAFAATFTTSEGLPTNERLANVLRALLLAPGFLFPTERAPSTPEDDHFRLSRLTLALWSSLPDADTVAKHGPVLTRDPASVVNALLADRRAERFFRRLARRLADVGQLGELPKAEALKALFPSEVQRALADEVTQTMLAAFASGDRDSWSELLTSPSVLVDRRTAGLYGLSSVSDAFEAKPSRSEEQRSGLLTRAGLLSVLAHSNEGSVVRRGVFVLERLLCVPPPPPPKDVPPLEAAGSSESSTQRERLALHSRPGCAACHRLIDGVGYGLERYDAIGRFVAADRGQPLTGAGTFPQTMDGPERSFSGAQELGKLLAASSQARECFVAQVHAALTDRDAHASERAALDEVRRRFLSGGDARALVLGLLSDETTSARY